MASAEPEHSVADASDALGFQVFLAIAVLDDEVEVLEVEAFQRLYSESSWCRSTTAKQWMSYASENYTALWKAHAAGESTLDINGLRPQLGRTWWDCGADERAKLRQDVDFIAKRIGGARRSFVRFSAMVRRRKHAVALMTTLLDEIEAAGAEAVAPAPAPAEMTSTRVGEGRGSAVDAAAVSDAAPAADGTNGLGRRVWKRGRIAVRCVQVIAETHDIKTFRFRAVDDAVFSYLPGQSATLELQINDKRVLRTYTICSTPTRPDVVQFTIKRVPGGVVSNWMCDHVTPGFEMTIKGPGGRFSWARDPAPKVAFLSGGSGVTPLLSMTRYLADRGEDVDVIFFHFARAPEDLICDDELSVYERTMKSFRRVYCYSRVEEGSTWEGLRGYIDAEKLRSTIPDILARNVYLCGPAPFMVGAKTSLEALRFPMEQFFQESFGGAPAGGKAPPVSAEPERSQPAEDLAALLPTPSDSAREGRQASRPSALTATGGLSFGDESGAERQTATTSESSSPSSGKAGPESVGDIVVFVKSGVTAVVNEGDMLLEVAEEAGIEIESSCRSGTCGTCAIRKISGEVEMEVEDGLDDESREAGFILSCVGRVKGRVEIDV